MRETSYSNPILSTTPQRHPFSRLAQLHRASQARKAMTTSVSAEKEMKSNIIRLAMQWGMTKYRITEDFGMVSAVYKGFNQASATSGHHGVITAFWVSSSSIADFRLVLLFDVLFVEHVPCAAFCSFLNLVSGVHRPLPLSSPHLYPRLGCNSIRSRGAFQPHPFPRDESRQCKR
jgi:hypothetical protein